VNFSRISENVKTWRSDVHLPRALPAVLPGTDVLSLTKVTGMDKTWNFSHLILASFGIAEAYIP
jgi:hypothetical protein